MHNRGLVSSHFKQCGTQHFHGWTQKELKSFGRDQVKVKGSTGTSTLISVANTHLYTTQSYLPNQEPAFGWPIRSHLKGDLRTICRFSYMKVYKLITLSTKFKTLLSLGRKITMFSKFITNYIEQGWWHSSLTLKYMHLRKWTKEEGMHTIYTDELVYQVVL